MGTRKAVRYIERLHGNNGGKGKCFDLMSSGISETKPAKIQGIRIILRQTNGEC